MDTIHPHWRATDDDQNIVISKPSPAPAPQFPQHKSVSRRPAALAGIALVLGIGIYFMRDSLDVQGQVSAPLTVHVTDTGFEPAQITVKQGDTITFMNDSPVPQVIESDTLCSSTGYCLYTSTLFPGDTENFTITQEFNPGTFTYTSTSNGETTGEIVIAGTSTTVPEQPRMQFQPVTTSIAQAVTGTGPFDNLPIASTGNTRSSGLADDFLTNPNQPIIPASIPQNPYALGSDRVHPFDANGEPIESLFDSTPHSGAPRPISQPETGPGLWAVILLSFGGIFVAARRSLKQEVIYKQF